MKLEASQKVMNTQEVTPQGICKKNIIKRHILASETTCVTKNTFPFHGNNYAS